MHMLSWYSEENFGGGQRTTFVSPFSPSKLLCHLEGSMTLNFWLFCLYLLNTGPTGMCLYAYLTQCWEWNLMLNACEEHLCLRYPPLIGSLSPSWSGTHDVSQAGLAMQSFCHSLLSVGVIYVSHCSFHPPPHSFSLGIVSWSPGWPGELRMTLSSWSPCLHLQMTGISGVYITMPG